MSRKMNRKSVVPRNRRVRYTQDGVSSSFVLSDAGGLVALHTHVFDFGLGATAVKQILFPTFPAGVANTPSESIRIRISNFRVTYLPYSGTSSTNGSGAGYAVIIRSAVVPTVDFATTSMARGSRRVMAGQSFSLNWRPTSAPDTNWVNAYDAQTSLMPPNQTSVGWAFLFYLTGCPASHTMGVLLYKFTIEVEQY